MFLSEVPAALLRRWYIVALGLSLTVTAAMFVADTVPPAYTVTAQTVLLPPANAVPAGGNPYLSLGGLNAVGDILSAAIRDQANLTALGFTGGGEFEFFRDQNSAAPMMIINVTAPTAESARAEANAILARVPAALKNLQTNAGVPSSSLITNSVVVSPGAATSSTRSQLRAVLATSAVGLALTVLLVAAVDRLLRGRRRRVDGGHRNRDAATPPPPDPEAQLPGRHLQSEARSAERAQALGASEPGATAPELMAPGDRLEPGAGGDPLADLDAELASDAPSA